MDTGRVYTGSVNPIHVVLSSRWRANKRPFATCRNYSTRSTECKTTTRKIKVKGTENGNGEIQSRYKKYLRNTLVLIIINIRVHHTSMKMKYL